MGPMSRSGLLFIPFLPESINPKKDGSAMKSSRIRIAS